MKKDHYKIIYTKALIDVKDKIIEIKKFSTQNKIINIDSILELIDININNLYVNIEKETKCK